MSSTTNAELLASQETSSLVTRLAGPSTGKAGLATDQTEINRIITDASKGSKFYEVRARGSMKHSADAIQNEKKKDKELTQRIEKILQLRDDCLKSADIGSVEQAADRLIDELESQRDLSQVIVHIDMDAFYASVELLDNPGLVGKPFGVGRGILSTASYEARKNGVRSGMPGFIAKRLCPELIFVPHHFPRYMELSNVVMSVFRRYDPNLFAAGCDEAYLNITEYCKTHNLSATVCVQEIRKAVFQETKLTASAGIAATKMLAKICSDKNKPNGQFELPHDSQAILSFLNELSIRKIPGVGRVNERLLDSIGIKTCGDIFTHRATVYLMDKQFGSEFLFRTYLGITSNVVQSYTRGEKKSIGAERTFSPMSDQGKILDKLDEIAAELEKDMTENGWAGRTITLKFKLDTYQVFTRAKSFDRWITKKAEFYATGKELLLQEFPITVRLIGLRVTKLKDLRAPPEPINGIKRFFGPLPEQSRSAKKGKMEHRVSDDVDSKDLFDNTSSDTMPGFHELDEEDHMLHIDADDDCESEPISPKPAKATHQSIVAPPAPLVSGVTNTDVTPRQTVLSPAPRSSIIPSRKKPHSSRSTARPDFSRQAGIGPIETHSCPLCGKTLRTDNQGLNSHIDFCLSRGAIRQAHAEASNNTSPIKASASSLKPISKTKGKGKT